MSPRLEYYRTKFTGHKASLLYSSCVQKLKLGRRETCHSQNEYARTPSSEEHTEGKAIQMKKSLIALGLALFASIASAQSQRTGTTGVGLNIYCDPAGQMYTGGSPLFNEATGEFVELEDYLARKQLNIYCDPSDQMYAGGSPLFNEATGESISLEDYLATKRWARGVNQYCDPIGTMYIGGTPLFDERTGKRISKVDYLAAKGLNVYCDALGTVYTGGNPLFDPATGRTKSLTSYLARKFVILR